MTVIIGLWVILLLSTFEVVYKTKKNFDFEILTTGHKWIWQNLERPKYEDFIKKEDELNQ